MILVVMPTLLWFGLGIIHQIFWTFSRRFLWFDGAGSVLISSRRFSRSMDGLRSMMKDRRQGWAGCQPGRVESIGSSESSELISSRGSTVIHISVCEQQKDSFSSLTRVAAPAHGARGRGPWSADRPLIVLSSLADSVSQSVLDGPLYVYCSPTVHSRCRSARSPLSPGPLRLNQTRTNRRLWARVIRSARTRGSFYRERARPTLCAAHHLPHAAATRGKCHTLTRRPKT